MDTFDVSDIDRNTLIRTLWENTPADSNSLFSVLTSTIPPPSDEQIEKQMNDGDIDYLKGKPIKINFKDLTNVKPWLYDRDAGEGTFEKVVKQLRK